MFQIKAELHANITKYLPSILTDSQCLLCFAFDFDAHPPYMPFQPTLWLSLCLSLLACNASWVELWSKHQDKQKAMEKQQSKRLFTHPKKPNKKGLGCSAADLFFLLPSVYLFKLTRIFYTWINKKEMKENNPRNIVTQVLILLLQIKCVSGCFFYKIIKAKAFYTNTILLGKRKHFIFKNAMLCLIETVSKILWNLIDILKKKKGGISICHFVLPVCFFFLANMHYDEQRWIPAALSSSFNCILSSFKWLAVNCVFAANISQVHLKALWNVRKVKRHKITGGGMKKEQGRVRMYSSPSAPAEVMEQIANHTWNRKCLLYRPSVCLHA